MITELFVSFYVVQLIFLLLVPLTLDKPSKHILLYHLCLPGHKTCGEMNSDVCTTLRPKYNSRTYPITLLQIRFVPPTSLPDRAVDRPQSKIFPPRRPARLTAAWRDHGC